MPKTNRIWTLSDLKDGDDGGADDNGDNVGTTRFAPLHDTTTSMNNVATSSAVAAAGALPPGLVLQHIPTLPNFGAAQAMLDRVVREFAPIVTRRGYNVRSITEMCCCGDGMEHITGSSSRQRGGGGKKRVSDNLWGYNQTTWFGGRKSHTIHLRLRHARDHGRLHVYEDVAGTLAHELAHCVHGPHNAAFDALMNEILDEHASLLAAGLTAPGNVMAPFAGAGQKLGGSTSNVAQSRLLHGQRLGGGGAHKALSPRDAALAAAEGRRALQSKLRLRGDRCCQPCVIELDTDGNVVHERDVKSDDDEDRKPAARRKAAPESTTAPDSDSAKRSRSVIDLTTNDGNALGVNAVSVTWACRACTFFNPPLALACCMCATERPLDV